MCRNGLRRFSCKARVRFHQMNLDNGPDACSGSFLSLRIKVHGIRVKKCFQSVFLVIFRFAPCNFSCGLLSVLRFFLLSCLLSRVNPLVQKGLDSPGFFSGIVKPPCRTRSNGLSNCGVVQLPLEDKRLCPCRRDSHGKPRPFSIPQKDLVDCFSGLGFSPRASGLFNSLVR